MHPGPFSEASRKAGRISIAVMIALCWGCVAREPATPDARPRSDAPERELSRGPAATADTTTAHEQPLRVHFIDVGQGDCTLVQCPDGRDVLIDCGSLVDRDKEATEAYLLAALADDRLEVVVITHPDADHYNMVPFVLRNIAVDRLLLVGASAEYDARTHDRTGAFVSNAMRDWIDSFDASNRHALTTADVSTENRSSLLFGEGDTLFYVLAADAPQTRSAWAANTRSIVLRVSHGKFDAIFTGDATTETEKFILGRFSVDWLDSEVLKIGHHGSCVTSTSPQWASAVRPEVSIASATIRKKHGHPNRDVVLRLAAHADRAPPHELKAWTSATTWETWQNFDRAVYCTANSGHIVVESDGATYSTRVGR